MDRGGIAAFGEDETGLRVIDPAVQRDRALQNRGERGADAEREKQGDEGQGAQKQFLGRLKKAALACLASSQGRQAFVGNS